jgi:hypothetical protein
MEEQVAAGPDSVAYINRKPNIDKNLGARLAGFDAIGRGNSIFFAIRR